MTKGPNDEKRPADAVSMSVMVAQTAIGEMQNNKKSGKAGASAVGNK